MTRPIALDDAHADDVLSLAYEASLRHPDDLMHAALWVHRDWRTQPDATEQAIQRDAVSVLRARMSGTGKLLLDWHLDLDPDRADAAAARYSTPSEDFAV